MNTFGLNIILAIAWVAFTGSVSLTGLITGFAIGYGALWLIQPLIGTSTYFTRVTAWIKLIIMFHYELVLSSLEVAVDVLTPRHRARPSIIEMPLDVKTDTGILLVTNLISLTPGTLSLDVSEDRKTLMIHAMFADDHEAILSNLKNGMERWVIEAVEGAT